MVREQVGRSQWKQSGRPPTACVRAKLEFPPRELVTKKAPSAHRVRRRENAIYKSSPKFSQSGSFLRFVPPILYRRGRHMSRSYSVFFLLLTFFFFQPFSTAGRFNRAPVPRIRETVWCSPGSRSQSRPDAVLNA